MIKVIKKTFKKGESFQYGAQDIQIGKSPPVKVEEFLVDKSEADKLMDNPKKWDLKKNKGRSKLIKRRAIIK